MKIFISGPMTGLENYNFTKFNAFEKLLTDIGYDVVNPVNICKKYKRERVLADKNLFNKMISEELEELKTCDAIFLLSGWENSNGARKEVSLALDFDKKIYFEYRISDLIKDN